MTHFLSFIFFFTSLYAFFNHLFIFDPMDGIFYKTQLHKLCILLMPNWTLLEWNKICLQIWRIEKSWHLSLFSYCWFCNGFRLTKNTFQEAIPDWFCPIIFVWSLGLDFASTLQNVNLLGWSIINLHFYFWNLCLILEFIQFMIIRF